MDTTNPETQWRVLGQSVIGTSHVRRDQPCQDAFVCRLLTTGELVIAVSDGAGSARLAAVGSAFLVETSVGFLENFLNEWEPNSAEGWEALLRATFAETRTAMVEHAAAQGVPLRDYSATLLVSVLTDQWTATGLIGDCAAVYLDDEENLSVPCLPQRGEFANTTKFLVQTDGLESLDVQVINQPVRGFAAFSDGLLELALHTAANTPHERFFAPLFAFVAACTDEQSGNEQLAAFLDTERVNARTSDDKTLILAYRLPSLP